MIKISTNSDSWLNDMASEMILNHETGAQMQNIYSMHT